MTFSAMIQVLPLCAVVELDTSICKGEVRKHPTLTCIGYRNIPISVSIEYTVCKLHTTLLEAVLFLVCLLVCLVVFLTDITLLMHR